MSDEDIENYINAVEVRNNRARSRSSEQDRTSTSSNDTTKDETECDPTDEFSSFDENEEEVKSEVLDPKENSNRNSKSLPSSDGHSSRYSFLGRTQSAASNASDATDATDTSATSGGPFGKLVKTLGKAIDQRMENMREEDAFGVMEIANEYGHNEMNCIRKMKELATLGFCRLITFEISNQFHLIFSQNHFIFSIIRYVFCCTVTL